MSDLPFLNPRFIKTTFTSVLFFLTYAFAISQAKPMNQYLTSRIDSLIHTENVRPFNGVIIVSQDGFTLYEEAYGSANPVTKQTPLKADDQFIIGSISKQITAVLVLREYEKGRLKPSDPINKHLPGLKEPWANEVTIHHLMNHTHGITALDKPLNFKPGSRFEYSQVGYELLGQIVEKTSGKSFETLTRELFDLCDMSASTHPADKTRNKRLKGWTRQKDGSLKEDERVLLFPYTPAGLLVSTAPDLIKWNENLHHGKLLSDNTYREMISSSTTRNHPKWGEVEYCYGLQRSTNEGVLEIGHSGQLSGYVAINFYYPESKTSVVVLENFDSDDEHDFYFESEIRKIVMKSLGQLNK